MIGTITKIKLDRKHFKTVHVESIILHNKRSLDGMHFIGKHTDISDYELLGLYHENKFMPFAYSLTDKMAFLIRNNITTIEYKFEDCGWGPVVTDIQLFSFHDKYLYENENLHKIKYRHEWIVVTDKSGPSYLTNYKTEYEIRRDKLKELL